MKKLVKLSVAFLLVVSVLTVFCGVVAGSASVVVASADAAVESAYEAIVFADSVGATFYYCHVFFSFISFFSLSLLISNSG